MNNNSDCYRVLIIEHEDYSLVSTALFFLEAGFRVDISESPQQALESISRAKVPRKYDLIILNLSIPDIKPLEIVRQIRAFFMTSLHIPIISIIDKEYRKSIPYNSGVLGYINKPISYQEIYPLLLKINSNLAHQIKKYHQA